MSNINQTEKTRFTAPFQPELTITELQLRDFYNQNGWGDGFEEYQGFLRAPIDSAEGMFTGLVYGEETLTVDLEDVYYMEVD